MAQKQKSPAPSKQGANPNNKKDGPDRNGQERRIERHEQAHDDAVNPNKPIKARSAAPSGREASHPANKEAPQKPALQGPPRTSSNPAQPAPSIRGNPEAGKPQEQRKRGRH